MLRGRGCPASGIEREDPETELARRLAQEGLGRAARAAARCGRIPSRSRCRTSRAGARAARRRRGRVLEVAPRAPVVLRRRPPRPGPSGRGRSSCATGFSSRAHRRLERLPLLAEREAHVAAALLGVVVEDARRDRRDADLLDQVADEGAVVVEAERPEVGADEVRARGGRTREADAGRAPATR